MAARANALSSVAPMHATGNALPLEARRAVVEQLVAAVCDGIDMVSFIKMAHWNLRGPHFAALHPLFDTFAADLTRHGDELAERATALGGHLLATSRQVAKSSRLAEYPQETVRDLDHVKAIGERLQQLAAGLRAARQVSEDHKDDDTVELLTGIIIDVEQKIWFMLATLGT